MNAQLETGVDRHIQGLILSSENSRIFDLIKILCFIYLFIFKCATTTDKLAEIMLECDKVVISMQLVSFDWRFVLQCVSLWITAGGSPDY